MNQREQSCFILIASLEIRFSRFFHRGSERYSVLPRVTEQVMGDLDPGAHSLEPKRQLGVGHGRSRDTLRLLLGSWLRIQCLWSPRASVSLLRQAQKRNESSSFQPWEACPPGQGTAPPPSLQVPSKQRHPTFPAPTQSWILCGSQGQAGAVPGDLDTSSDWTL